jgi:hypothetical protein
MIDSTPFLLTVTACVIGTVLAIFYFLLRRRGLFDWTHAGFWAWVAFALYFAVSPGSVVILGDYDLYAFRLAISGGAARALWIMFVAVSGIIMFFIAYLRTTFKPIRWGIRQQSFAFTPPVTAVMAAFLAVGFYSLLAHRAGLIAYSGEKIIESSRFTGDITGYGNVAHKFIFVPMFLFLISKSPVFKGFGWFLALSYFAFSLPHHFSRYISVSLFVALSIQYCINKKSKWPKIIHIVIIVLIAMMFQIRGHVTWEWGTGMESAAETIAQIPEHGLRTLGGTSDTAMLSAWYVKSALEEWHIGYDYGLPFINYVLMGWIPNRFFPQKYFLVDWLRSRRSNFFPEIFVRTLYGSKSTMLGSFYGHGGIWAVLLCMATAGYLCRRLDGMLAPGSPNLVKAVGIGWFSTLWMDWGSGDTWVLMNWGSMAIPGLFLWLFWRKTPLRERKVFIRQNHKISGKTCIPISDRFATKTDLNSNPGECRHLRSKARIIP